MNGMSNIELCSIMLIGESTPDPVHFRARYQVPDFVYELQFACILRDLGICTLLPVVHDAEVDVNFSQHGELHGLLEQAPLPLAKSVPPADLVRKCF